MRQTKNKTDHSADSIEHKDAFDIHPSTGDTIDAENLHIGIVQSRFNEHITCTLRDACAEELLRLGVQAERITWVEVPGALEIAIALQNLALSKEFDALIALGCVIRGETYHFELVSNESASAITRVGLDFNIPIINAVLTTENTVQAMVRSSEKGKEAGLAAVEMAHLMKHLSRPLL
jgi:6,7-dimethyl-8-ribityllumazine synthase